MLSKTVIGTRTPSKNTFGSGAIEAGMKMRSLRIAQIIKTPTATFHSNSSKARRLSLLIAASAKKASPAASAALSLMQTHSPKSESESDQPSSSKSKLSRLARPKMCSYRCSALLVESLFKIK
jgi:hypothetical protein